MQIVLEADSAAGILNIVESRIFDMPEIIMNKDTEYYNNVINLNGRIIVTIHVSKLHNKEEIRMINDAMVDSD